MKNRIGKYNKHYYTGNHLSSTQLVTDGTGGAVQQVEYAPFGEVVNEYNIDWSSGQVPDFKFNGKELDEENGMYYFEHRYHAPPTFISRDKYFDLYPFISPYVYCANNPLKYIDPTGNLIQIIGSEEDRNIALAQMQSRTKNITFSFGENGIINATVNKRAKLSKEEQYMLDIATRKGVTAQIVAGTSDITSAGVKMAGAGAFMGTTFSEESGTAVSRNEVNIRTTASLDKKTGSAGNYLWHEIAEGFEAGVLSIDKCTSAEPAFGRSNVFGEFIPTSDHSIYNSAHNRAGKYFGGALRTILSSELNCFKIYGDIKALFDKSFKKGTFINPVTDIKVIKVHCVEGYEVTN
ncbi:MAG: RHS repeat-associated core domain-containing protein [Bacteroidales bacterium]|jgi:RHS repeat-associated protein|nr:RHS repeat-associated core domain-containing protein [Bacteroidales bacterium]